MADSDLDSDSSDSDIEWDWQPTLQEKIKEILSQYPDDAQILKEIIQNAEDADAKCVKFLYDKKSYTTVGLEDETSVGHQGEALYAYNDAVFTKADFDNLLNVRKSAKQTDRSKVGRFGQGFKSIFHMTELPTVLSGRYWSKISPYLPKLKKKKHSKLNKRHPAELQSFRGEFQGYSDDVARKGRYTGTIFRFPLRKRPSEISKTLYGEEKIMDLFRVLQDRAYMNLLFLKSLERIEVYVQDLHETKPRLLFLVCVGDIDKSMLKTREKFFREIHATGNETVKKQCHITYQFDIQTSIGPPEDYHFLQSFLVCHYYDGRGNSSTMKKLLDDKQLSYQPLVSVAMPLNGGGLRPEGHIFCVLPLPIRDNTSPTGLPVHVSGFFVVSSNRSEIKWPTAGQNRAQMTDSLEWNNCLLTELIPRAYAQLLLDATGELSVHSNDIYQAFPNIDFVDEKWRNTFLEPFLQMVLPMPILATKGGVKGFVSVSDAVLCPPNIDKKTRRVLVQVLTDSGYKAVCPPEHISRALENRQDIQLVEATADCVLQKMKQTHCYRSYSRDNKLLLLSYLQGENPVTPAALHGLELLPLADGTFATFGHASSSSIFIAESKRHRLLPTLENRFMSNDLETNLDTRLRQPNMIGHTQLALCTDEDILSLLPSIFPRHCAGERTIKCVRNDEQLNHINDTWLENLWKFLTSICSKLPDHLDRIKQLHILPIQLPSPEVIHLTKLSGGATCIVKTLHDETLSDQLAKTLGHFDVKVLDEIPEYVRCHPLVFQRHGIYNPNPDSVIRALLEAYNRDNSVVAGSCKFNQHSTPDQRLELVQLFQPVVLSKRYGNGLKQFLEHLELFATVDGSGKKRRHFTSVAKCPTGVTGYTIPVISPCLLLDVSTTGVRQMAPYIGVSIVTETKIIEDHIFDQIRRQRLQPSDVENVMVYVLQNLHDHIRGSKTFLHRLQELAFLTDRQGRYCRASDFFDPSDIVLQNLFQGEDRFPPHTYQRCLDSLRRIGLKDKGKVTGQDLINTAKLIAQGTGTITKKQKSKSNLELKIEGMSTVLLENQNLLHDANTNTKLRQLAWVPVRHDRPSGFPRSLAWGCGDQKFQTPSTMCLSSDISVVGSVMPSVDPRYVSDIVVERVLGRRQLPLPRVMQHLKNIVMSYHAEEKVALMGFVQKVYEAMQHYSIHDVKECLTKIKLVNWVWQGNGFASVDCIIPKQSEDFAPYAYSLPGELSSGIRSWLHKMGVRNECDWLQILQRIRRRHDGMPDVNSHMVACDLRIVMQVLPKIVSQYTEEGLKSQMKILLLPVQNYEERLQLLPACDCTYAEDQGCVLGSSFIQEDNDESVSALNYTHHSIPKELAEALGVKTSMNRLLEDDSEGISIVESHGQVESLTHRLKLLIQDYPDGLAIPKELIQNADDAGATVVKFLYDERENLDAMDGLLDDGMKECQGPALWVYNDAEFSDADLKNIAKLSGATKEDRSDKIGKFGLGFNVVYNVTDVPSFISNQSIVFLDPHRSHLGKAKKEKSDTGLQLKICSNSKQRDYIRRKYYNQFRTYDGVFGCQLRKEGEQKPFKGTLFRLPLRPSGAKSEINSMPYTKDDVEELFQLIIDQASSLLLFVQSVKSVELHHLPRSASDPSKSVRLFHLETKLERILKPLPPLPPAVATQNTTLLTTASRITHMVEHEHRFLPKDISRTSVVDTHQKFYKPTSTRDQLAINGETKKILWLVNDCIGTGESMTHARRQRHSMSYVPVAGVAIKLEQQNNKYQPVRFEDDTAPVFCHLPLPSSMKSGLPVIVNGSFAIKSDRRQIVQITSDDKLNNPMDTWNETLKKDTITNAYIGALVQMKEHLTRCSDLYSLWPDMHHIANGFGTFLQSFYGTLATLEDNTSPKIFTNGSVWVDFSHTVFLDEALANSDMCDVALDILQRHLDRTTPERDRVIATVLPRNLKEGFPSSVVKAKTFDLAMFYKAAILPILAELNSENRNKLLLFALKRAKGNTQLRNLLMQNDCIPVGQDGTRFVKPVNLVSPKGRRAKLYETRDNVFPIASFCDDKTLGVLKELGMNVDDISWNMVIERALSIGNLNESQQEARLKQWVPYVEQKLQHGVEVPDQNQLVQLRRIRFLPVLPKPENYPITWKGDIHQGLVSAEESYPSRYQNLVSSTSPIVDEKTCGLSALHKSCKIREILGLQERNVSLKAVLQQLTALSVVPISRENQSRVREICHDVYSYLELCCKNNSGDAAIIKQTLSGSRCILADSVFMDPLHCAMQGSHIPRYLHVVQYPLNRQQQLLKVLSVKEQFHGADFVHALNRIDSDTSVKVVRDIAEGLHSWLQRNRTTLNDVLRNVDQCQKAVLLPTDVNAQGEWKMLPVKELCLNAHGKLVNQSTPKPWLRNTVGRQNFRYIHPDIPIHVAQALGVHSDRQNVLSRLGTPLGQPFGQKEPLTTRIKSILQNYPCDEGVLKELLQNADDAGATQLRFILDKRQHKGERVFDDNWKLLQGPALCVYNNKPFTEKDLDGICSLGRGSKSSDPTKTGQYGIGFNSVYHLTDVPCFLTDGEEIGRTFGILDPNCSYAPGACMENPGRSFQGGDFETVHADFTDVFSGYLEDSLVMKDATLFRLPLRSKEMAETSKISNKVVITDFAEKLLRLFEAELFQNLLFVNSVRTISLESIGRVHEEKYSVHVKISESDDKKLHEFNKYVKGVSDDLHNDRTTLQNVEYREVIYTVRMEDSKGQVQIWSVCQCIGFREKCEIPDGVAQAAASKDLALLPRGGAALLLDSSVKVKLGRQIFCFLPLPSREDTKLPVHINGHFALDSARRTLWDDGQSCPGYKSMWNSLMMEKIVAQAYVSVLMNECNKLKRKQHVSQEDLRKFYSVFPDISKIKVNFLNELVSAFYTAAQLDKECLAVQTEMVDYVATRWFSISQCLGGEAFFDNLSPTRIRVTTYEPVPAYRTSVLTGNQQSQKSHTTTKIDQIHSLTNILRRLGFNLLSVPMFIYLSLRKMKINVRQVEPKTVLEYLYNYRGHGDCTLRQLPQPVTESPFQDVESVVVLTKYCYPDHHAPTEAEKEETKSLVSLPLCVTDDEVLQEFSQTKPQFYPMFSSLVPHHSNLFVVWQVYNAIPVYVREKKPLALGELTIAKLAPLLLPEHGFLQADYRLKWDPTNEENAFWKKWIGQIWDLINSEIDKVFEDLKGNREATLRRLEPLKQFCIVPAHDSSQAKHFLYQLKYAKCIRDERSLSWGYMDDTIQKLLLKAGIPRLDTLSLSFTASLRLPLPREIVSHVDNPRDILYALWDLLQHDASAIRLKQATGNRKDALQLREYFTNLFKKKCTTEEATRLRELPIHQFVNDSISSLGNYGCYLVPLGIPKAGLDNWYSKNTPEKFIFLTGTDVDQLYRTLGAVEKTTVDLYVELILKKIQFQQFLNEKEQLEHLAYLAVGVIPQLNSSSREYKALIASLQNLPFLKNPDGNLELAKGFFDPTVPLFKAMETNFPPKHFHNEGWLQFLELCGLKRTVTGEDLRKYAEKIEDDGKKKPTTETEDKAKLICDCLKDHDEAILFQLKDIEFLPIGTVPTDISNLHPQYLRKKDEARHGAIGNKFISFQDSVMYENFEQCWTVAKVLPSWLQQIMVSGNLQKPLGVQNPVKLTTITQHCVRLSRHLSSFNLRHQKPGLIADVMNNIYGQLGARAEADGAQSHERLREKLGEEPCVWIKDCNSFVLPQQVAVALPEIDQILPYLHKLPRTLLKHVDLMTAIGVKSDPDHTHYMMVLKMIKDEVGDSDLESDVNTMVAASKAIFRCLPLLCQEKKVECELPLYMLSRKTTLELSSELYHVDRLGWENRLANIAFPLPLLYLPDAPLIQLHYLKYIKIIPELLRPKKLSCLLEEVPDEESLVAARSSQTEDTTTDWFKDHIQNEDFCLGLHRLLRHDALEQDFADSFEEKWSEVMKRLMKIQFYTVDKLVTVLKYKNGDIIPGTNSEWQKVYIKTSAIGCEVYVVKDDRTRRGNERTSRDIGKYSKLLKIIIKESFQKLLPQTSELLEVILRTPMNDISTMLDEYNITHCTSRSKMYPTLGSFIPLSKHGLLTPDFLQFFPGEYIGFELEDPLNEGRAGQATYIYAKVVEALPFDDTEMEINRQYNIDIGDRRVNVFSSSMYKLSRHVLKSSADNVESQTYDLEKVEHQIAADLDYAFYKLTIEERNRVLKRMVMKWQPDNHPEHRDIAATILRFIDEKIKKIENDANRPGARGGSGDTKWYGVDNISAYASQRAQEQRAHIQRQRGRLAANDRARGAIDDPDDYSYLSENGLNPQPGEAKRLYRQAAMDLNASLNDTPNGDCEWALYKCHQAAEKALKAVYYMRDSEQFKHHDLRRHAEILDDPDLYTLAGAIDDELGDGMKLRYPDRLSFPKIPHDLYKEDTCTRIYELAKRLLKRAEVHLIL